MKSTAKNMLRAACIAAVLGGFVSSGRAEPTASSLEDHGTKVVKHVGAKIDKLATLLCDHAKKTADRTKEAASRLAAHVEKVGHKAGEVAKKTADKVESKIDRLTD